MIHPSELSIDLSPYEAQLNLLQQDPATRIVGSLGRMVACQEVVGRPFQEFEDRRIEGLLSDGPSDIDVLGTSLEVVRSAQTAGRFAIDDQAFRDSDVTLEYREGWTLRSSDVDFSADIDDRAMRPVRGVIQGVEIVTVPLLTHKALHLLRERHNRKDQLTSNTISYLLHQQALHDGVIPRDDLLKPFAELQMRLSLLRLAEDDADARHSGKRRHSS